jgi:MFS superfamily sulfate permease-like transporter
VYAGILTEMAVVLWLAGGMARRAFHPDVDFTAAETLRSISGILKEQGIRLVFAVVSDDIRTELDRSGITRLIGEDAYYATVADALNAYREKTA